MRIPYSWLKEHAPLNDSPQAIADTLVGLGHEVEGVEQPRAAVKGVRTGRIIAMAPHPDADRLKLLKVDIGAHEPLSIVCGATNMSVGDHVPVATVGTVLPNGLKIKKGRIRGQTSFGMCCSEAELGLAEDAAGLLILPASAPVGMEIGELLDMEEAVFDLSITPNRGDCMSAHGIARDLAAALNLPFAEAAAPAPAVDSKCPAPSVAVSNTHDCPVYMARRIDGVVAGDSPAWMQRQLICAGQRPVNGIVDVLNYVMLYLGQPMHAFDADRIGALHIRSARAGEQFEALDGRQLSLDAGDLVVADETSVLALAGIMGSLPSGVTESTTSIVLESAFFRPARVSLSRRSHAMVSEASMRFERGVDPLMVEIAMQQATKIITDLFGGSVSKLLVRGNARKINAGRLIDCDVARIEARLGVEIPASADAVLTRIGFGLVHRGNVLEVKTPPFRHDVTIAEDMSEEYARIIGFDAIPALLPALATISPEKKDLSVHHAVAGGFVQAVTYAFISADEQRLFVEHDGADIELENPISEAMSVMRRSIWPGLLNTAKYNLNRQQPGVRLVEQGRIYRKTADGHSEANAIAWLMCGEAEQDQWHSSSRQADFFDLKGALESWLTARGLAARFIADDKVQGLQSGQSARLLVGRTEVGVIGKLDEDIAASFDIEWPVFVAHVNLDILPAGKPAKFSALAEFPAVERDLVFLFNRDVCAEDVLQAVRKAGGSLLTRARIFDRYSGKGVPDDKISLGVRFTLQDSKRTLVQEDSDAVSAAIVRVIGKQFGASLRA
jgi:phenylalanyl-tRNA synthetase beta chain